MGPGRLRSLPSLDHKVVASWASSHTARDIGVGHLGFIARVLGGCTGNTQTVALRRYHHVNMELTRFVICYDTSFPNNPVAPLLTNLPLPAGPAQPLPAR